MLFKTLHLKDWRNTIFSLYFLFVLFVLYEALGCVQWYIVQNLPGTHHVPYESQRAEMSFAFT